MHCLDSKETGPVKFVKLGMVNRSQTDDRVRVYGIEELFKRDDYDRIRQENDIALIKLNDTIHFDAHIYPICLPSKQHYGDAIITGFGTTGEYDASSQNLLKASLQHFTHAQCQDLHPKTRIFPNTMMCYGHRNLSRDACRVSIYFFPFLTSNISLLKISLFSINRATQVTKFHFFIELNSLNVFFRRSASNR